ncbi:MBL fold metallo-hydrolase [Aestuariispira insulae]|uniref:Phosphoribosyl 1,2-cyclic phosphodiesterase n=1 Tax=Aestuariispira insulae TaxID=1461337 RepID=A0A3D9HK01_9PROT|nr:MBL fold metallo-hydrolase [Aestuariispira insulae]RED49842.1 phosphoribosyl 1,2-cyclic phosphodiesterase [Aestuariispira insulae]
MTFEVKFWGVRGSVACPSPRHIGFGGNTSCVEVDVGGEVIIFDAGTGIRNLGNSLMERGLDRATLMLSHTHWDHINGFPFFVPAFMPTMSLCIMAGQSQDQGGIERVMSGQMSQPFFPIPMEAMRGKLSFQDFEAGDSFDLAPDIRIRTAALNHPNGATGYRVEYQGKSMCYVTDTEHVPGKADKNILNLIQDADLVIYDSTYTEEEFVEKVGWGHSTWEEGMRLCQSANVGSLAIFHHDPTHEDDFMEALEQEARQRWEKCFVARENMSINLM